MKNLIIAALLIAGLVYGIAKGYHYTAMAYAKVVEPTIKELVAKTEKAIETTGKVVDSAKVVVEKEYKK